MVRKWLFPAAVKGEFDYLISAEIILVITDLYNTIISIDSSSLSAVVAST